MCFGKFVSKGVTRAIFESILIKKLRRGVVKQKKIKGDFPLQADLIFKSYTRSHWMGKRQFYVGNILRNTKYLE